MQSQMSSEESSINTAIVACFDSVLHQADEVIQDAAIDKLEKYLKGNLFDPSIFIQKDLYFTIHQVGSWSPRLPVR